MEKYDIQVIEFNDRVYIYTLTNGKMPEKIKIDLYLDKQWTINWGAYGNQNIKFANEFMAVMKKAIEMMEELNAEILDKAIEDGGI